MQENEEALYRQAVPYLLDWYDANARILPWREEKNAYHTWISEIMLQQTRVEAVRGYYNRFLRELPDIPSLCKAPTEQLLKLWEGLGYYSRVRNLQKAANIVCEKYGGVLPSDYEQLKTLPGIGTYTAGAIASIAYDAAVPAVDGNVLRVMKRISGSRDDITRESVKKALFSTLQSVIPTDRPGDFNQAVMDLGAGICVPNAEPHCKECPVMHLCKTFREGMWREIPYKPALKKRRVEQRTVLVIKCQGRYLLHKRADNGLLAGLWEIPAVPEKMDEKKAIAQAQELLLQLPFKKNASPLFKKVDKLPDAKHIFSHVEWRMSGYLLTAPKEASALPEQIAADYALVDLETIRTRYSLPSAFSAYLKEIKRLEENAQGAQEKKGNDQ